MILNQGSPHLQVTFSTQRTKQMPVGDRKDKPKPDEKKKVYRKNEKKRK